jgi:hypothetical protein
LDHLKDLRLHFYNRVPIQSFHIPKNVTSMALYVNVLQFTSDLQNRKFDELTLVRSDIKDLSLFRYVIRMSLVACNKLEDIEPLKNVQFLDISHCNSITNFSCLGSQRMLLLQGCSSLTNSDVERFSNIRSLMISSCHGVTRLPVMNNTNLVLYGSVGLEEINLSGNYILLNLNNCQGLKSLNIAGHVEELFVKSCPGLDMKQVTNYTFFTSAIKHSPVLFCL